MKIIKEISRFKLVRMGIYFLFTVLFLIVLAQTAFVFKNVTMTGPDGKSEAVKMPFNELSKAPGAYIFSGILSAGPFQPNWAQIVPDDIIIYIKINDQQVSLQGIGPDELKDYMRGFPINLGKYLHPGDNKFEIKIEDYGGRFGVGVFNSSVGLTYLILYSLLTVFFIMLLYEVLTLFKMDKKIVLLLLAGLLVRFVYLSGTSFETRTHDVSAHIAYVVYLAEHVSLPPIEWAAGGAWYHPPVYYATAAVVYSAAMLISNHNIFTAYLVLQLYSVFCMMGFLYFSILIIRRFVNMIKADFKEPAPQGGKFSLKKIFGKGALFTRDNFTILISSILVFWPVNVIHSARIGNDCLMYFLYAVGLFYALEWHIKEDNKYLVLSCVFTALATLTKTNAMFVFFILGIVFILRFLRDRDWKAYAKMAVVPIVIFIVTISAAYYQGVILKIEGKRDRLFISNIHLLSEANLVGNTASNYFWFDSKIFITEPFTSPFDDRLGRQYFWNYLWKTGLFGEFDYSPPVCRNTAVMISFLFICMFLYIIGGLFLMTKEDFKEHLVLILNFILLWLAITYLRISFPANIDFRYIVPILITFSAFMGYSVIKYRKKGWVKMEAIGYILISAFVILSIIFSLGVAS